MGSFHMTSEAINTAFSMLANFIDQGQTTLIRDPSPSIVAYDDHIHAIEKLMRSLLTQAHGQIATLKRSRNSLAPIHRLPDEVLVSIWLLSVQDAPQKDRQLHHLALVCKSWHRGVMDHPVLWCYLQDSCKSEWYNDWVLQKSGNCPLHLQLSSDNPYTADTLINMVMPESRRWESFTLAPCFEPTSVTAGPRLSVLRHAKLDNLMTFEAHTCTGGGSPEPIPLPPTPALRGVRLERFPLVWQSFHAPQLQALCINSIQHQAPTYPQLLALLRSTPNLESLLLKDTWFVWTQPPNLPDAPIHLPKLRSLFISLSDSVLCDSLLRVVQADNLERLLSRALSFKVWDEPNFLVFNNIQRHIPSTGVINIYYHNNIHIATDPHPFWPVPWPYPEQSLKTNGFAFTTRNLSDERDFLDVAQWVSGLGNETTVRLELRNVQWRRRGIKKIPVELLDYLPTLHTLTVREGVDVEDLLAQLALPKQDATGTLRWPWPHLVELRLEDSPAITATQITNFAESRWGIQLSYDSQSRAHICRQVGRGKAGLGGSTAADIAN